MRWGILCVAIAARAIGAGAREGGRFEAALARWLARSVGGDDDGILIAPVNGRVYSPAFGVVAVPKCFPRCAAAGAVRPEVRETWAATRDDLLASAPNEIEAAVERFFAGFEAARATVAHGDALLVNDERVRAFFDDAVDVEGV